MDDAEATKSKTLFVSTDCGISYYPRMKSSNIDELVKEGEKLDEQMLRWYIEDDDGNMDYEHLSSIHQGIVDLCKAMRAAEEISDDIEKSGDEND